MGKEDKMLWLPKDNNSYYPARKAEGVVCEIMPVEQDDNRFKDINGQRLDLFGVVCFVCKTVSADGGRRSGGAYGPIL